MTDQEIAITGCQHGAGFVCELCWPKTDQEINEAVARKLGIERETYLLATPIEGDLDRKTLIFKKAKDYCHSIEAAWEIVEKMSDTYEVNIVVTRRKYRCHATGPTWKQMVQGEADTAPMAICLAFLKLPG